VTIVHLHVPRVAEPGFFARPFAGQACVRMKLTQFRRGCWG